MQPVWWAWAVRLLPAVAALCAVATEGVHTAAARPVQSHYVYAAIAAPSQSAVPPDSTGVARPASTDHLAVRRPLALYAKQSAAPADLAEILAQQEHSRRGREFGTVVATACAAGIPGVLIGIAFFFAALWSWERTNVLAACVAGIFSAASIITLVALPEMAHLWERIAAPSTLQATKAAGLSLLGIFSLLFLYLLYPSEVRSVRIWRIDIKPPAADAVARPAPSGGGAGLPATAETTRVNSPNDDLTREAEQNASEDDHGTPASKRRRLLNTVLLFTPMPVLGLSAGAAFLLPSEWFSTLFRGYEVLSLFASAGVGFFLWGVVRRRRSFARVVASAYGLMIVFLIHDALVRSDIFWGSPASHYALIPFLAVIGWTAVGQSIGRWRRALERSWTFNRELEKRSAAAVAEARSLESAAQMQQRFVTSTSHELRSPLTSILGFTELLEDELSEKMSPSHRGFIQSIRESAHRLLTLVNDLLDLARAEDAGPEMRFSAIDVDEVVDDAVRHIYPLAQVKRLAMYLEKEGLGAKVWADSNRLRQVVINLLSNAVKFTSEGRIFVRVRSAKLFMKGRAIAIEIEDTGRGISPEFMPRLFERFTREDDEAYEGTGLGLAISKEFVEAMGGEIRVESRLGEGSRFTIVLPRAPREL